MAVHGRPALPHETPNNSPLSRPSAARPAAGVDLRPCATGVLLGVLGDLGVSMPWGYRPPACAPPLTAPFASYPSLPLRTRASGQFLRPARQLRETAGRWGGHARRTAHVQRGPRLFPRLRIVLGHMGEALPFWLWRLDYMAQPRARRCSSEPTQGQRVMCPQLRDHEERTRGPARAPLPHRQDGDRQHHVGDRLPRISRPDPLSRSSNRPRYPTTSPSGSHMGTPSGSSGSA